MKNQMIFLDEPAKKWENATPIGCGCLGAMIYGSVAAEKISLNEEHVWSSSGENGRDPNFPQTIQKMRQMLLDGNPVEAERYAAEAIDYTRIRSFEYAGTLDIRCHADDYCAGYGRTLYMREGIAQVKYTHGDSNYTREYFASYPHKVIVCKFTSDNEDLQLQISYNRANILENTISADTMQACFKTVFGEHKYYAAVKAITDGTISSRGPVLKVSSSSRSCVLLIKISQQPDITFDELCYDTLRSSHIQDFSALMDRAYLDLDDCIDFDNISMDDRLMLFACNKQGLASLASTFFQFGRYLLASSSRPGTLPANLQGIWSGNIVEAWSCDYHTNINLQQNYWLAEVTNLSDCHLPLFDYLNNYLLDSACETAKVNYNCRGAVIHHLSDIYGYTALADGPQGFWPMGAAWLSYHFWEHYLYTEDMDFLKNTAYRYIKETTRFLLDYMFEDENGYLLTGPSMSPENRYYTKSKDGKIQECFLTLMPTIDIEITQGLFQIFQQCADLLDTDRDMKAEVLQAMQKLPPLKVGKHGQLMEWMEDYDEVKPGHIHTSPLFGLYPGTTITQEDPAIYKAAEVTLDRRMANLDLHVGHCYLWNTALYARLRRGNDAATCFLKQLVYCSFDNMLDAVVLAIGDYPRIFQIEGNLGMTGALAEMFLQSHAGAISILPALPDSWKGGKFHGLCARGGFEVSAQWNDGMLTSFSILSKNGEKDTLIELPETMIGKTLLTDDGTKIPVESNLLPVHIPHATTFTVFS